jgi:hypothetical protein
MSSLTGDVLGAGIVNGVVTECRSSWRDGGPNLNVRAFLSMPTSTNEAETSGVLRVGQCATNGMPAKAAVSAPKIRVGVPDFL